MTYRKTLCVFLTLSLMASQAYAGCGGGGAGGRGFRLFGRGRASAGACSGSAMMTTTYSYSSAGACAQGYAPQYPTPQYPQPTPQQMRPAPATYGNGASNAQDYGFVAWINGVRGQRGLRAVTLDAGLCQDAATNSRMGFGHGFLGRARRQNAGQGQLNTVCAMWLQSPGHASALLDPSISVVGIAEVAGVWTFDAR